MNKVESNEMGQDLYKQFVQLFESFVNATESNDEDILDMQELEDDFMESAADEECVECEFSFNDEGLSFDHESLKTPTSSAQEVLEELYVVDAAYDLLQLLNALTPDRTDVLADLVLSIVTKLA